eukprot:gene10346-biopygen7756
MGQKISFWAFGCGNWRPGLIKNTKKIQSSLDPKTTLLAGKVAGNCENWCTQTQKSRFSPKSWKSGGGVGKTGVPKVRQIRTNCPGVGRGPMCKVRQVSQADRVGCAGLASHLDPAPAAFAPPPSRAASAAPSLPPGDRAWGGTPGPRPLVWWVRQKVVL